MNGTRDEHQSEMSEYPGRCGDQVVDDRVRVQAPRRVALFEIPIARAHEHASRTHRARKSDVDPPIASDERTRGIDPELGHCSIDESARRLAAVADNSQAG